MSMINCFTPKALMGSCKRGAIKAIKQLGYDPKYIKMINLAKTPDEIDKIMKKARMRGGR